MEELMINESVLLTSGSIGQISEALAKAQSEITMSEKDGVNPHFKSSYSTLSSSLKAGKGPASKNGLAVIQASGYSGGQVTVQTLLSHKSNEWLMNILKLPVHKNDIHTIKSTITYGRRIGYDGILGIAPGDDDDDGNEGAKNPTNPHEITKMKDAKKLRTKINSAFKACTKMGELENLAREFKGDRYGFWEEPTFTNPGETFGKIYLTHKDRIGNEEARYSEEGHEKWRVLLYKVDAGNFLNYLKNYQQDERRQNSANDEALQNRAQDLGMWDEHTKTFMTGEEND